jgi:hypothetical protein
MACILALREQRRGMCTDARRGWSAETEGVRSTGCS